MLAWPHPRSHSLAPSRSLGPQALAARRCLRRLSASEFQEVGRDMRENLDTALGDEDVVFDSYAAPAWQIGARLDGEDHAGRYRFIFLIHISPPAGDPRIFVYFDT